MNNLWSQKCSELRSHSQYNVKLSIITSLEQPESMLRREKCYRSPPYSRHRIISAKKNACKLLKQASNGYYSNQIPKSFFLFIYIDIASLSCRVVHLKLPIDSARCVVRLYEKYCLHALVSLVLFKGDTLLQLFCCVSQIQTVS